MKKSVLTPLLALIAALAAPFSVAEELAPDLLLKSVTLEVLSELRQDKDHQGGNPAKVADLVETKILPLFDFVRMTQIAAGQSWTPASPQQRKALTAEFRTMLVRTYSTVLSGLHGEVVEFKPLRAPAGDREVTVKSVVRRLGAAPLTMDYEMEKVTGGWLVYDIKLEGVSLITTYRDTFADTVRDRGMDGLIKLLADKNRLGDARFRSHKTGDFFVPVMLVHALASRASYIK